MDEGLYYKLAHENGWDFLTGEVINFRESIGSVVRVPKLYESGRKPDSLELRAFDTPNKSFMEAWIPCSAYRVAGTPLRCDDGIYFFDELEVVEELTDLDALFGWNYTEAANPINPLLDVPKQELSHDMIFLAGQWVAIWPWVHFTYQKSGFDPTFSYIWQSVGRPVSELVRAVSGDKYPDATNHLQLLCYAYALSIFGGVEDRGIIDKREWLDGYILHIARSLWRGGVVPVYVGKWRLHSGPEAEIIWEEDNESNV